MVTVSADKLDGLDRKVFLAAGPIELTIEDLLAAFDRKRLTPKAREEIWEQLILRRQLVMKPGPQDVQHGERVTLTSAR